MKTNEKQEQARRSFMMQVHSEGASIEKCLKEIPESDIDEDSQEEIDLIGVWEVD